MILEVHVRMEVPDGSDLDAIRTSVKQAVHLARGAQVVSVVPADDGPPGADPLEEDEAGGKEVVPTPDAAGAPK